MGCKCMSNQSDPQYCNDIHVEQISICQDNLLKNNQNKYSSQSLSIKSDLLGNVGIQVEEIPSTTHNILKQKSNPFRLKDISDLSSKNETFNRMNSKIDSSKNIRIRTTVSKHVYTLYFIFHIEIL